MGNYNTFAPVCTVAPLSQKEAFGAPSLDYLAPGSAVIKQVGEAAMVGEFQEVWWCGRGSVFAVDVDGNVYPELRPAILRYDTQGTAIRKMIPAPVNGVEQPPQILCDWSEYRNLLRLKGWYRVDPVLKEIGATPSGLLTDQQWRLSDKHLEVVMKLRDPKALARVAEINGVSWRKEFQTAMSGKIGKILQSYFAGLDTDERRKERKELLKLVDASVAKWITAFEGAMAIAEKNTVQGDQSTITAPAGVPAAEKTNEQLEAEYKALAGRMNELSDELHSRTYGKHWKDDETDDPGIASSPIQTHEDGNSIATGKNTPLPNADKKGGK